MAEAGKLTCVPAGAAASVARVKPFCEGVIGRAVVDLSSEEPGTASHVKGICNIIIVSLIEAVAEAHVLAEKTGLKTECLQSALATVWGGPYGIYSDRMSSGDYHRKDVRRPLPLVGIDMALHMADGILAMAKESNTELAGYQAGVGHMKAVAEYYAKMGSGLGDISGIYGAVRTASGMQFENGAPSKQN
ncbi:MAG: hypothetical protein Q9214_005527 [Letrouitia sp. 1 TL-2023]